MRIYGLHSGRNKPAYYLARSYMWASRETKRNNTSSTVYNNNLTGREQIVPIRCDFDNEEHENSELDKACSEWLNNNNISNSAVGIGVFLTIIGFFFFALSVIVGVVISGTGLIVFIVGCIDDSIKRNAQEKCKPVIEYDIEGKSSVEQVFEEGIDSQVLYTYTSFTANAKAKVNSGATNIYDLKDVKFSCGTVDFLKVNVPVYCFKSLLWELYFLPDLCLYKQGNMVKAIKLSAISVGFSDFIIRITDSKPSDCDVVGYTWQYVNKNGSPDRRYNNNQQIPICKFGEIQITSNNGLNIRLLVSKYSAGIKLYNGMNKLFKGIKS